MTKAKPTYHGPTIESALPVGVPPGITVLMERSRLLLEADRGTTCACCGQNVKVYKRAIHGQMARWLILLVRATRLEAGQYTWTDVKQVPSRGGDYGKLTYWGLVEQHPEPRSDTRTSGLWRPTAVGVRFVKHEVSIPRYAYVYNEVLLGLGGELRDIVTCLGRKFSYPDLMAGRL